MPVFVRHYPVEKMAVHNFAGPHFQQYRQLSGIILQLRLDPWRSSATTPPGTKATMHRAQEFGTSNGKGAPIGKQIPNPDPPNRGSHWPITCCDSERPVPPALASRLMSRSSEPRFPTQVSALRTRRRNCTKGWRAPQERPGNAQVRWSRRRIAVASPQVRKRQG